MDVNDPIFAKGPLHTVIVHENKVFVGMSYINISFLICVAP